MFHDDRQQQLSSPTVATSTRAYIGTNKDILECPESHRSWYCLNEATCFAVKVQDDFLYSCWCLPGYHGPRCDFKYIRPPAGYAPGNNETISQGPANDHSENQPAYIIRAGSNEQQQLWISPSKAAHRNQQLQQQQHDATTIAIILSSSLMIMIALVLLFITLRKRFIEMRRRPTATTMGRFDKAVNDNVQELNRSWRNNRQINHDSSSLTTTTTTTPVIGLEIIERRQQQQQQWTAQLHLHHHQQQQHRAANHHRSSSSNYVDYCEDYGDNDYGRAVEAAPGSGARLRW